MRGREGLGGEVFGGEGFGGEEAITLQSVVVRIGRVGRRGKWGN